LTPAKQFVAKVVAALGTAPNEPPRPYVVVAPSQFALKVARHEIVAALSYFDLPVKWVPSRRRLFLDGAEIEFYAGRDWCRFLGYCIYGYWVIGPGSCSPEIIDECKRAVCGTRGWSLMSEDAA
jgi:hypothetical protein